MKLQKLKTWLAENEVRGKALANHLNVSEPQISYWCSNGFLVLSDEYGHCELVKSSQKWELEQV